MRFTIKREEFLKGLNIASRAVGSKVAIAVLNNFKLDLTETGLLIFIGKISVCGELIRTIFHQAFLKNLAGKHPQNTGWQGSFSLSHPDWPGVLSPQPRIRCCLP